MIPSCLSGFSHAVFSHPSFIQSILSLPYTWTLQNNMLAVLFILGALIFPLNLAELQISLLNPDADGVLASKFPNSFLLRLPDCSTYGNKTVDLLYQELPGSQNNTQSFKVPSCLVSQTQLGYPLKGLKNGTTYSMWYRIENVISSALTDTTTNATDYREINDGLPARSGAMVVITVILSLAMALLLVGIIVTVFFSK
ncbi:uncharacterized protein zgc:194948 [Myxocyprinus asiaticus]|uniref:uncharacterized protein zgc:194948 n=1 Tax=Myxocyprinus asiaticus TaxID=70543 RepID=UPI00222313DD|nr:uncharacterized protein zgc:194948 [Myxocyprinus asiaticus]